MTEPELAASNTPAVATSPQHVPCPWHEQTESTRENDDFTSEQACHFYRQQACDFILPL